MSTTNKTTLTLGIIAILFAAFAVGVADAAPKPKPKAGRVTVNGLSMYYDVQGSGRPLVLLHGALTTNESSFGAIRPALAKKAKTIAIEQQAHGHTPDRDAPITIDQMTEDTAALLESLGIQDADVVGYSMGGSIALRLAVKHPKLVRRLVVVSAGYSSKGLVPGFAEMMKSLKPSDLPAALRDEYARVAPDPKAWDTLATKIFNLPPADLRPEDVRSIKARTLIIQGDNDIVTIAHAGEMKSLIAGAQLAIYPGADHFPGVFAHPDWLATTITTFLAAK